MTIRKIDANDGDYTRGRYGYQRLQDALADVGWASGGTDSDFNMRVFDLLEAIVAYLGFRDDTYHKHEEDE